MVLFADLGDRADQSLHFVFGPVHLDEEDCHGVQGIPRRHSFLDCLDTVVVHHLDRDRDDPLCHDPRDGVRRILNSLKDAHQGLDRLGLPHDSDEDLGGDPKGPLRADEDPGEIVAERIQCPPTEVDDVAVGKDDLQSEDMVRRHPILRCAGAAGVLGDVPPDAARRLAGGIGGVIIAPRGEGVREPDVHQTGLDHGPLVLVVDVQDLIHPVQPDENPPIDGKGPSREPCSRSPRHKGDPLSVADLHDLGHLFCRAGQDDDVRHGLEDGQAVRLVDSELAGIGDDTVGADDSDQLLGDSLLVHHQPLRRSIMGYPWCSQRPATTFGMSSRTRHVKEVRSA